jgi:hypothetical protein
MPSNLLERNRRFNAACSGWLDPERDTPLTYQFVLFLVFFFESLYLVVQVSNSYDSKRTNVLQTVLVLIMFSSLEPTHSDAHTLMPLNVLEESQELVDSETGITITVLQTAQVSSLFSGYLSAGLVVVKVIIADCYGASSSAWVRANVSLPVLDSPAAVAALGSFLFGHFESIYLVIEVSDCNDTQSTIVLQSIFVLNMFASLVPCTRLITYSRHKRLRTKPQVPLRLHWYRRQWSRAM